MSTWRMAATIVGLVIANTAISASANSERVIRVEPAFFFRGGNPFLPLSDTPEEARDQWIGWYESMSCAPRHPQIEAFCIFGPLEPEFYYGTINGWRVQYKFTFTHVAIDHRTVPPSTSSTSNWAAVFTYYQCPVDFRRLQFPPYSATQTAYCQKALPSFEPSDYPRTCNPILISSGTKIAVENDYVDPRGLLSVERIYRSDYGAFSFVVDRQIIDYSSDGPRARSLQAVVERNPGEYLSRSFRVFGVGVDLIRRGRPSEVQLWAPANDVRAVGFTEVNGSFSADNNQNYHLRRLLSEQGALSGWVVTSPANIVEAYDANGLLRSRETVRGQRTEFTYLGGRPAGMVDSFGRSLQFEYDSLGRLSAFRDPAGQRTSYSYRGATSCSGGDCNNLLSVTYPGDVTRSFLYNEAALTSGANLPYALTGMVDENGWRVSSYRYNTAGEAVGSNRWAGPGILVDSATVTRVGSARDVIDALGTTRRYFISGTQGQYHLASQNQPAGSGCGPSASSITYDAQANVTSRIDFSNNKICYAYDLGRNLETKRVEGLASGANCSTALSSPPAGARLITTDWHPDWRLATRVAEPKKITTNVYHGQGATCAPAEALVDGRPIAVVCSRTEQATTDESGAAGFNATTIGTPRTWSYTYTTYGRVLTATDPNNKTTVTTYHPDDDPDLGKRGNVATLTNAANHVTSITDYNPHGQPIRIVDANGLVTILTYDPRIRLRSRTVGTEASTFDYDPRGLLELATLPDGATLTYGYDNAHRLTSIVDHKGNRVDYTLDPMGNRTAEQLRDPGGVLVKNIARVIDALNRVERTTGAMQ